MFGFLKKKKDDRKVLEIEPDGAIDCIADFTYNFYWQHGGEKLKPDEKIPGTPHTFKDIVDHLINGGDIKIIGDAGHRLCSSMGVDLKFFGGTGKAINVGNVIVEGDVDTRMGISMVKGSIYVKGKVKEPFGNLVEVKSDKRGYRKFRSITDIVTNGLQGDELVGAFLTGNTLIIKDGHIRDTIGARMDVDAHIIHEGDVDLSTGILMKSGSVRVNGNAGRNTAALLDGGMVIINGDCDDFSGIEMKSGLLIVNGDAGKFLGAQRKGGSILAKEGKPVPPTSENKLTAEDKEILKRLGFKPHLFKKFC